LISEKSGDFRQRRQPVVEEDGYNQPASNSDVPLRLAARCLWIGEGLLNHNPLDLIEAELVAPAVVELRRARRGVVRHRRGLFKGPAQEP
jgi:hypothetical protein